MTGAHTPIDHLRLTKSDRGGQRTPACRRRACQCPGYSVAGGNEKGLKLVPRVLVTLKRGHDIGVDICQAAGG